MIRRRDVILAKLKKRSYSVKQLAEEFGISRATARKHIELLRKEGHSIRYDRRDKRYYTQEAVSNMSRTEGKLKHFLARWIGSTNRLRDEETINRIYRVLGEGAAEVEEKTAQLILRYIIRHHSEEGYLTMEAIQESLGIDQELVEKVLCRLVRERVIARKEYGEVIFYGFEEKRAGFIEAVNKGYLTLSTGEIEELFTIRESTIEPQDGPALNSLSMYRLGKKRIYRWVPRTAGSFLIPELFNAFTTSFSRPQYEAMNGSKFSGHGYWEYMPQIIRYQQGPPEAIHEDETLKQKADTGGCTMTSPEDVLVEDLIHEQSPQLYLFSLLGFIDRTTQRQLAAAKKTVGRSKIRSLLTYHKGLYEKIKRDGTAGIEEDIQQMKSLQVESQEQGAKRDGALFCMVKAHPSAWLTAAYLTMLGKVFEYAMACATAIGFEEYISSLEDYSETFTRAAKELEVRHPDEAGISDKPLIPLQYEATGEPSWLAGILKLDVEELLGTANRIRDGENFIVKGRYTLSLEQIALPRKAGKEARQALRALKGHETGHPAAVVTFSGCAHGSGSGFQLYPGSRPFEATTEVRGAVRGDGKTLDLNLYDVKNQKKVTAVKRLTLH